MNRLFISLTLIIAGILPFPDARADAGGSGFFVTTDGYFVTNYHIIKDAKSVLLLTIDDQKLKARVIRSDVANDLTLLKVEGTFPALPIATSSQVRRGQSVATIGYPQANIQGVEPKVTEGIVSSLSGISDDPRMFQISVPIQPGNSGGPLFTNEGNVIGIIVAELSAVFMLKETGDIPQNVNYAIKSNYLIELLKSKRLGNKLIPAKKGLKSLEDITSMVEKATALVVALSAETLEAAAQPPAPAANPSPVSPSTPAPAPVQAPAAGEFRDCPGCPVMVSIPGKNYAFGKYEVTQQEWEAVMGNNPSSFKGANLPVENVSWNDTQEYLIKLNKMSGQQYHLPTEAEWENACDGGNKTGYCGGENADAVAWHEGNSDRQTHPAGLKQPNGYGLHDMSGNVSEWVEDCWEGDCGRRVRLGGSWDSPGPSVTPDKRFGEAVSLRSSSIGFRLARKLP